MVGRSVCLALIALVIGCEHDRELGRELSIEDDFSEEERAAIKDAIDEWNLVSLTCTGEIALEYGGIVNDADGFQLEDLGGDDAVIYRWSDPNRELFAGYHPVESPEDMSHVLGWATPGGIVMFPTEGWTREYMRGIVLHEIGHFLWLGHINFDEGALMYPFVNDKQTDHLTPIDIEMFCIVYDCDKCSF